MTIRGALLGACFATVAWGALAFGAVYLWAYTPLVGACLAAGTACLVVERRGRPRIAPLSAALASIALAVTLQLIPLPVPVLARISPGTDAFLRQYNLSYRVSALAADTADVQSESVTIPSHAMSIAPARTALGLALFAAFAVFLLGATRLISAVGSKLICRLIVGLGFVMALVGMAQRAWTRGDLHPLIYGFWQPRFGISPFGPFVNPNHFAGWMLMALPIALGGFLDGLLRTIDSARPREADRIGLVGSPDFSTLLSFGTAYLVMGVSLFMTRSRSGVAAFAIGTLISAWVVYRRQASRLARMMVGASVVALLLGTAAWAGLDSVLLKTQAQKSLVGRVDAWHDTLHIMADFPVAGTGLDTYGAAMTMYQSGVRTANFVEAHNDYLQLAAEGGLLVGVPVLAALAIFVTQVRRRFREAPREGTTYWLRVGAVTGLISIALQSFFEFSLQMPGNAAFFALIAAVAVHQSPSLAGFRRTAAGRP